MNRCLVALGMLLLAAGFAAASGGTYRWVDAEGRVHYSDKPHPGAEEVTLPKAQTFEPAPVPARRTPAPQPASAPASVAYTVRVVSPTVDEVLWNIEGDLAVRLSLSPALRGGDGIRIIYDGQVLTDLPETELSFTIPEVYRGTHTLAAAVIDDSGSELARSPTVTFHVRQNSIIN